MAGRRGVRFWRRCYFMAGVSPDDSWRARGFLSQLQLKDVKERGWKGKVHFRGLVNECLKSLHYWPSSGGGEQRQPDRFRRKTVTRSIEPVRLWASAAEAFLSLF